MMDCFVLPSLYEGLPVVGVEAQANGLKRFFSDQVTKEAKLLDKTEFLSINKGTTNWENQITNFKLNNLSRLKEQISNTYDISFSSQKLLNLYLIR